MEPHRREHTSHGSLKPSGPPSEARGPRPVDGCALDLATYEGDALGPYGPATATLPTLGAIHHRAPGSPHGGGLLQKHGGSAQFGLLLALGMFGLSAPAHAGPTPEPLTVLRFEHADEDAAASKAFRRLLEIELSEAISIVSSAGSTPCGEFSCAQPMARAAGAEAVVFGSLLRLGSKIQVVSVLAEVATGQTLSMSRMSVDTPEDLTIVAQRMAPDLLGSASIADGARLGTITSEDDEDDRRREGDDSFLLRLGGFIPLGDAYSGNTAGIEASLAYGFETRNFLIEPRIGLRWSAEIDGPSSFVEVPIDIGVFYITSLGDFAPFIGGGVGIRYLSDERLSTVTTGSVIQSTNTKTLRDDAWAFGGYARAGVMLLRTYSVRLSLFVDYNLALTTLNTIENPQAVSLGIGVHF